METEQKPEIHGHLKILGKDLAFLQKRIFLSEFQKPYVPLILELLPMLPAHRSSLDTDTTQIYGMRWKQFSYLPLTSTDKYFCIYLSSNTWHLTKAQLNIKYARGTHFNING